jgi:branched-chain amino acid transport system substrate-binding protein
VLRRSALVILAGAVAALLYGCPPPAPPANGGSGAPTNAAGGTGKAVSGTLTIGHFACLTGATAMFGQSTEKGVQLAIDELNKAGGGLQAKVETLDDASKVEQAVPVVTRLISQYQATAIVGEVASGRSIAAAPVCDAQQVPMVSPSSTNPDVTVNPQTKQVHPYVFRVCFTDPFQGAVMARFAKENLKLSRAAVLKDIKNPYRVGLAEGFKAKFTALQGQVVGEEAYSEGDKDFRTQLTKIQGLSPEVLIVPGYYNDAGLIVQQARTLGMKQPIIGGDGWDSPTLTKGSEQYFTDCYFSNHFSPEEKRPGVAEFVKAYQAKFNGDLPNALGALGYDAVKIVADAARRAGSLDRPALKDALAATKDYPGVTGQITIDAQHNAVKSAVVVRVDTTGGKTTYPVVTTIAP